MTTTTRSSELLKHANAVNEAVLAYEDAGSHVTGDKLAVADAIQTLVTFVQPHMAAVVSAIGEKAAKKLLHSLLWANDQAQAYRGSLRNSGTTHVAQGVALLRAANNVVSSIMDNFDTIMEELDK